MFGMALDEGQYEGTRFGPNLPNEKRHHPKAAVPFVDRFGLVVPETVDRLAVDQNKLPGVLLHEAVEILLICSRFLLQDHQFASLCIAAPGGLCPDRLSYSTCRTLPS